jgi:hypothetical protein
MHQPALFHDSIFDALGTAVQAAGGVKKVSAALWPTLDTASATARLRGALNPDHAQKLCPLEVLAIGRLAKAAGEHSVMRYLAAEWGYAEPQPIEPADQAQQLDTEIRDLLLAVNTRLARRERIAGQIKAVRA